MASSCPKWVQSIAGGIYLTGVIILWVASGVLIQIIFASNDTDFGQPLFLTYYATSFFVLYLIPVAIRMVKEKYWPPTEDDPEAAELASGNIDSSEERVKLMNSLDDQS